MLLPLLCLTALLPAALACAYYLALAIALLVTRPPRRPPAAGLSFAVVIPAHNEERTLADALRSCAESNYPAERARVWVIADNCTDQTAAVARQLGADCLERHDSERRGKGHALAWAMPRVLADRPDAVLVLDADCRLDRHALRSMAEALAAGAEVAQAKVIAVNVDASPASYAVAVGNQLENDWFWAPKGRLGLAVFLRGTGMAFRRELLERYPWQAASAVEDLELSLQLLRAGVRIAFVEEASVSTLSPAAARQLGAQRRRWAAALRQRISMAGRPRDRWLWADALWTRWAQSRPLALLSLLVAGALTTLNRWANPGRMAAGLLVAVAAVALGFGGYFALGVLRLGVTWRRLALLAQAPGVVARLAVIAAGGVLRRAPAVWAASVRETHGAADRLG